MRLALIDRNEAALRDRLRENNIDDSDILIGELPLDDEVVPVWMSRSQFDYWRHTHLTIDVVPGRGAGFSLEAPYGVRFLIRSRLLTNDELVELGDLPAPSA